MLDHSASTYYVVSGILEFTLFGIFATLSPISLVLLFRRHQSVYGPPYSSTDDVPPWRRWVSTFWDLRRSPLIFANVPLILSVTAHFVIPAQSVFAIIGGGGERSGALLVLGTKTTEVARTTFLIIDGILGDIIIVYRVWLIWGKNYWITLFPLLTLAGSIVMGSIVIYLSGVLTEPSVHIVATVNSSIAALCAMTVCDDHLSCLDVQPSAGVLEGGRPNLLINVAILVESAALWTFWIILFLVWVLIGSPLHVVGSGLVPVIVGITFVGLGLGQETREPATTNIRWAMAELSVGQQVTVASAVLNEVV